MQNLYQQDFPVDLVGVDCVAPKSCSGCILGIYIPGVSACTGHGGSCMLSATLLLDMEDPK